MQTKKLPSGISAVEEFIGDVTRIQHYSQIIDSISNFDKETRGTAYLGATIELYVAFERLIHKLLICELARDSTRPTYRKKVENILSYIRRHSETNYYFTLKGDLQKIVERFCHVKSPVKNLILQKEVRNVWDELRRMRNFAAHLDPFSKEKVRNLWPNVHANRKKRMPSTGEFMASRFASNRSIWEKELPTIQDWLIQSRIKGGSRGDIRFTFYTRFLLDLAYSLFEVVKGSEL